jgi:tetratricopeptide (TPR) repeat protein
MLNNLLQRVLGGASRGGAERTLALARTLLAQDRRTDVIDLLAPLIERQPDSAEARFLRGTALLDADQAGDALPDLARAAALKPAESRYLHNLALAYWKLGEAGKSAELCKAVLRISAFNPTHILLSAIELPGEDYYQVLLRIQNHLQPRTYL